MRSGVSLLFGEVTHETKRQIAAPLVCLPGLFREALDCAPQSSAWAASARVARAVGCAGGAWDW